MRADGGLEIDLACGEEIRIEISTKFTESSLRAELAAAGLVLQRWWTDGDYALSLATKETDR